MNEILGRVGKQWLMASNIIAAALHEWRGTFKGAKPSEQDQKRAAAILARLAANKPPLLLCSEDEIGVPESVRKLLGGCCRCEYDEAEGGIMNHCDACCRKITAAVWEACNG